MTNGSVIIVEGTLTITDASTGGKIQGGYDAGDGYGYSTSCVKVLEGATFNLQGGTLIGRVQDYDYTVSVVYNSNFTMTGGKITGGQTGVLALGNVTLTGGEISGNNIGVPVGENFSISGNPVITGNTVMNADLRSSSGIRKINITGALTDGANIGITVHQQIIHLLRSQMAITHTTVYHLILTSFLTTTVKYRQANSTI